MRLRKTNLDDLPQLKALWALGFGDTEQEIEAFLPSLTLRRPASARRRTGGSSPRPTRCRRSSPGASVR